MISQSNRIEAGEKMVNKLRNDLVSSERMYIDTIDAVQHFIYKDKADMKSNSITDNIVSLNFCIDVLLEAMIADYAARYLSIVYISLKNAELEGELDKPFWLFDPVSQNECRHYDVSTKGKRIFSLPTEAENIVYWIKRLGNKSQETSFPKAIYVPYLNLIISYEDGNNRLSTARYCDSDATIPVFEYPLEEKFNDVFTDGKYWYHKEPSRSLYRVNDFRSAIIYTLAKVKYYYENNLKADFLKCDGIKIKYNNFFFDENTLRETINMQYKNTEYINNSVAIPELVVKKARKGTRVKITYNEKKKHRKRLRVKIKVEYY